MTLISLLEITGASACLLLLSLALLRRRKTSDLFQQYGEALQAENNGEEQRAIGLYQEALNHSRKRMTGDKKLKVEIEGRLKTLLLSTSFEESFKRAKERVR
jgi:hypothetical protein